MTHLSTPTTNTFVPPPGLGGRYCAEVWAYASTACTHRTNTLGPTRALRRTSPFSSGSARLPSMKSSHSTSPAPVVLAVIDFPSAPSAGSHLVVGETPAQSPQHTEHSSARDVHRSSSPADDPQPHPVVDRGRRLHLSIPAPPTSPPMLLSALTAQLGPVQITGSTDRRIERVVYDSREAGTADVFVAIRGERMDARDFVPDLDVAAVIADGPVQARDGVTVVLVEDARRALAIAAAAAERNPGEEFP